MIIKCPECGHQVSDRAKTCPSCGIDIAGKLTRCPECGAYVFKFQTACPNCQCPLTPEEQDSQNSQNSQTSPNTPNTPNPPISPISPISPNTPTSPSDQHQPTPPRKKGRRVLWTTIGVAFALALSILALGIYFIHQTEEDNELRAYRNAMLSTEPAVLQNFLDIYADASEEHRDSIKAHLEVLKKVDRDWKNAVASKSRSALLQFVERNPHNVHIPEARLIIDSLDFDVARVENTMEAYQKYMNEHQQGSYYDEAASAFDRLKIEADARREKAIQDSIMASQGHTDHSDAPDEDQPLLYE